MCYLEKYRVIFLELWSFPTAPWDDCKNELSSSMRKIPSSKNLTKNAGRGVSSLSEKRERWPKRYRVSSKPMAYLVIFIDYRGNVKWSSPALKTVGCHLFLLTVSPDAIKKLLYFKKDKSFVIETISHDF